MHSFYILAGRRRQERRYPGHRGNYNNHNIQYGKRLLWVGSETCYPYGTRMWRNL